MNEINLKEVQQKLYEKLKPSGWDRVLRSFIMSQDFYNILDRLLLESNDGKKVTPLIKDMFRAFEECPYDKLKVVIIGQDPYPKQDVADGISFSCSKSDVQASMRYMYTGIAGEGIISERPKDLACWSNQGVLMLNTALTCQIGHIGSHVELWKPFTAYLFDMLKSLNTGIVYIFLGKKAEEYVDSIDADLNHALITSHPASAAYSRLKEWNSNGVFTGCNNILKSLYNEQIKW